MRLKDFPGSLSHRQVGLGSVPISLTPQLAISPAGVTGGWNWFGHGHVSGPTPLQSPELFLGGGCCSFCSPCLFSGEKDEGR